MSLSKPTGLQTGDILFSIHNRDSGFQQNDTISTRPSGFAAIATSPTDAGVNWNRSWVDYKIVDGSEASTLDWIFNRAADGVGAMIAYRGVDTTTPFDVTPVPYSDQASDTSQIVGSISPTSTDCMLLTIVTAQTQELNQSTGLTPAGSMTERIDIRFGSFTSIHFCEEVLTASGATGTRTHTSPNSEQSFGWAIVLRPLAAGGPNDNLMGQICI